MSTNESTETRYYTSKETCNAFDISGSTLRKWCISLEKNGYEFARGEQNRRLFSDKDREALEYFRELIQVNKMSLENASIIIAARFKEARSSTGTPSVREEKKDSTDRADHQVIEKLNEHIEKQEQFNQELIKRLDEQNKYINERLDKRDQSLTETMNQLMEQRKEEIHRLEEQSTQKRSWLSRLFKK